MTKQEYMERLLFDISKASAKLLTCINEAAIQAITIKKSTDPEKKSTPLEKNEDPEKKSTPLEKMRELRNSPCYEIWTKWCDDVAPAFSSMFTDESEFHMKNLSDIITATIEAMDRLIDISIIDYPSDEKIAIPVKRKGEKKKTLRDVVAERYPESVGPEYMGYVQWCPGDYDLPHMSYCHGGPTNEKLCRECWLQTYNPDQE